MKTFATETLHLILLGLSNEGDWVEQGM